MSHRDDDLRMLDELLNNHADEITGVEVEAFASMRFDLKAYHRNARPLEQLTDKQRLWLTSVHERIAPQYANLMSRGLVPRGCEVASMVGALPKRPPPMPKEPAGPKRETVEHRPFRVMGLDEKDDD